MARNRQSDSTAEDGYFAAYARFAGTLRAWLVAYGVGGPALIVTQEKLAERLVASPSSKAIMILFLSGVASQVFAAVLYKYAMWYLYRGESSGDLQASKRYRVANWLSEAYLIETAFDLASIGLFGVATYKLLSLFTA